MIGLAMLFARSVYCSVMMVFSFSDLDEVGATLNAFDSLPRSSHNPPESKEGSPSTWQNIVD
jgi:hypothetical protein